MPFEKATNLSTILYKSTPQLKFLGTDLCVQAYQKSIYNLNHGSLFGSCREVLYEVCEKEDRIG